jgi:hypothetical protein
VSEICHGDSRLAVYGLGSVSVLQPSGQYLPAWRRRCILPVMTGEISPETRLQCFSMWPGTSRQPGPSENRSPDTHALALVLAADCPDALSVTQAKPVYFVLVYNTFNPVPEKRMNSSSRAKMPVVASLSRRSELSSSSGCSVMDRQLMA